MKEAVKAVGPGAAFWGVVLWLTWRLYEIAAAYAFAQRGYKAVGGEIFVWCLPAVVYIMKRGLEALHIWWTGHRDSGDSGDGVSVPFGTANPVPLSHIPEEGGEGHGQKGKGKRDQY